MALYVDDKEKSSYFPSPQEATHQNCSAVVSNVDGPQWGLLVLTSLDGSYAELKGQRVLFSRHRTFMNGTRLRYKDYLRNKLDCDDVVMCDIIPADEEKSKGEYHWLAVLCWTGNYHTPPFVFLIGKLICSTV